MWFCSYEYIDDDFGSSQNQAQHILLLRRGILLDTAPLFILAVGHFDKEHGTSYIKRFQSKDDGKEKEYTVRDYDYLLSFLNSFGLGKDYKLIITPHIFTEFVKHAWKYIENKDHFLTLMRDIFNSKAYIEERYLPPCSQFCSEKDFLDKTLEIGDVSLKLVASSSTENFVGVLTDDEPFAMIVDGKLNLLTIYYNEIRMAHINRAKDDKRIPAELLLEPNC